MRWRVLYLLILYIWVESRRASESSAYLCLNFADVDFINNITVISRLINSGYIVNICRGINMWRRYLPNFVPWTVSLYFFLQKKLLQISLGVLSEELAVLSFFRSLLAKLRHRNGLNSFERSGTIEVGFGLIVEWAILVE